MGIANVNPHLAHRRTGLDHCGLPPDDPTKRLLIVLLLITACKEDASVQLPVAMPEQIDTVTATCVSDKGAATN